MTHSTHFALPETLTAKADPALIAGDEAHLGAIDAALTAQLAGTAAQLQAALARPARAGQEAVERDQEVRRQSARLRALGRFQRDAVLGRIDPAPGSAPLYIGRFGLTDDDGRVLLVDWRAPAAAPFFAATQGDPMGIASRRRYRWGGGRIVDYWDEVFDPASPLAGTAAVDDQSAFIQSLGAERTARMRDVLSTIAADQDAIIRSPAAGALVVHGGPGTGKTVVALHRAAYLLYADPQVTERRGGVLVVGPHEPYLAYVEDVLPSLGEEGVRTATLAEMVPEGADAAAEADPHTAALKASARLIDAIDAAVAARESPPRRQLMLETPWGDTVIGADDWAWAFDAAPAGIAHNEARDEVWEALVDLMADRLPGSPRAGVRRAMAHDTAVAETFTGAWPLLDPVRVVARLWSDPAHLAACAPWLSPGDVAALQRDDPRAWTDADLPLLDHARRRIGDPDAPRRAREREAALEAAGVEMDTAIEHLLEASVDDDGEGTLLMLRGTDLQRVLVDETVTAAADVDALAGPFAHIVVDEAQELTDAQWRMILDRCPSRSLTIVGDRAQSRAGFAESWAQRLERVGLSRTREATLTINYRTPEEVMAAAAPVIRAAIPDANVPVSVRRTGVPVVEAATADLSALVAGWLAEHERGTVAVIGSEASASADARVRHLTPESAKGLEFDLVVLVEPAQFGDDVAGAVDRYVAMTRATAQLMILR